MIVVLRIGHRPARDKRITTHVGLVARAFGADAVWISGEDRALEESLRKVVKQWGGDFEVRSGVNWRNELRHWPGTSVHLTMYGERLQDAVARIPKGEDVMVVVGAEKVPREVYELADFNVAVGSQPHSEVAALALFLDRLGGGSWEERAFDGKLKIVPSRRGKTVVSKLEVE